MTRANKRPVTEKNLNKRGKRLLFKRVTNDDFVEYFCNKKCKKFLPEECFTPGNIKMRNRMCKKCMKEIREEKYKPDNIDRWRMCLLNYLYNYNVQDASKLSSRERVMQILKEHNIHVETTSALRIYPPNNGDLDDLKNYHVVVFDNYKKRKKIIYK